MGFLTALYKPNPLSSSSNPHRNAHPQSLHNPPRSSPLASPPLPTNTSPAGETDWSLTGRHTSTTDLPLTPDGKLRISSTSTALLGPDRLIAPSNLAQIYLSPMQRAQTTFHLLHPTCSPQETQITTTPLLHEWNYGIYEGLTTPEIRALRKGSGLDSDDYDWDIWLDGCEGGESPEDVEKKMR